ncbi:EamA family transporter RarD [Ketogulonicigenium vulgare]|uniref:Putative permease protein n=2 Tax=Ketogulonicigenium vulgare TaxID=92945 RepID=F9Y561_KETVW|nr:EamA family transporter RarD [Ketogulonicigenium vulgare]AEM40693.1 putative permease protein [Ketogulonicigenium vulgare WSH-001]ALJ80863.1 permease [Ketogulonicigenium vulgare]ANW33639.1 permease [Ketogulonicigenium vulgare]AOZ54407.1 putative permease protein [Ketogulonicigenium vulgare]
MRDLQQSSGVLALIGTYLLWGFIAIYFGAVSHVPPMEVLAYRVFWAAVFYGLILLVQGRFSEVPTAMRDPRKLRLMLLAGLMIAANWLLFIFAVSNGHATEASIGYYILPLIAAVTGFAVFREKLGRWQIVALLIAASGVLVLTLGLGRAPWVSLLLAGTFVIYNVIKRTLKDVPSLVSVMAEVILLVIPAALYLVFFGETLWQAPLSPAWWQDQLLLMLAGPITAIPLILFGYGAQRVSMATTGIISYMNPTMQLLVATLYFHEALTIWHGVALALIWLALAVYTGASLRAHHAAK